MNGRVIPRSNYAKFYRCAHDAMIRAYDKAGNVIEAHQYASDFKEFSKSSEKVQAAILRKEEENGRP